LAKVAISNLFEWERENEKKINEIAKAVTGAILSIPLTGLKEENISFIFPRDFIRKQGTVLVTITEASFFQGRRNFRVQQSLCRQVSIALGPILRREGRGISVEIKRPR
jgi:hypothetical protein